MNLVPNFFPHGRRRWLVLLILCVLFARPALGVGPESVPAGARDWEGVWVGEVPGVGWIAMQIHGSDRGSDRREGTLWWLVDKVSGTIQLENGGGVMSLLDHRARSQAALRFTRNGQDELQLQAGGWLEREPQLPLDRILLFRGAYGDWVRLVSDSDSTSEWSRFHNRGDLRPLPPQWPAEVVQAIGRIFRQDDHRLARVLEHPAAPTSLLAEALRWSLDAPRWNEPPSFVQRRVAANSNCDGTLLEELWRLPEDPVVWREVACHRSAPENWKPEYARRILTGPPRVRLLAASDYGVPLDLQMRLARENPNLRSVLARNGTSAALKEYLFREFPEATIDTLLVASDTPTSVIESIAARPDVSLQLRVIDHPNVTPGTRRRIVETLAPNARGLMITHLARFPEVPSEVLGRFAGYPDRIARLRVTENPSATEDLLVRLAADGDPEVAARARAALARRFPGCPALASLPQVPDRSVGPYVDERTKWKMAIEQGDVAALEGLASYFLDRGELSGLVLNSAQETLKNYRPELMEFLIRRGSSDDTRRLAGFLGGTEVDPRWFTFFERHGLLHGAGGSLALRKAIEGHKRENVAALLRTGVDANEVSEDGRTPLFAAVRARDLESVRLLLAAKANAGATDVDGNTPADLAARSRFMGALALLDRSNKYADLRREFAAEFPSRPKSPFVGTWTNGLSEFSTVVIRFDADATGVLRSAVSGLQVVWRERGNGEAEAFLVIGENGDLMRDQPLRFVLQPNGGDLRFEPPTGNPQVLHRREAP